jgi:hypothetical protein
MNLVKLTGDLSDAWSDDTTKVPFTVEFDGCSLWFQAKGYGGCCDKDGFGYPMKIEWYEGELSVVIWADINVEDPTHRISLSDALESKRRGQ